MREFLVEQYVARVDSGAVAPAGERARLAADELTREGRPVRYLRSIFVPDDETCFYLYEAESLDVVRDAAVRAALPYERIVAAVTTTEGHGGTSRKGQLHMEERGER